LEQRRTATSGHIVMCWGDDDIVTDDDGRQMTLGEYQRRHPGRVIQMTWGDEQED